MKKLFITATDTDAGKTFVSCALAQALINTGKTVSAYKPISAGCELINGQLVNEDALLLSQVVNCSQTIQDINPLVFLEPIAPHIAAQKQNKQIQISELIENLHKVQSLKADFTLVEGAGGWRLPLSLPKNLDDSLSDQQGTSIFLSDFVKTEQLDVILIVNMKLGCLNHALLTYEAIKSDGVNCIAWVANNANKVPMNNLSENIQALEQMLPIPKIAQLNYIADTDEQGKSLNYLDKIALASQNINLDVFSSDKCT